jgi:hypothetical protein
MDPLKRCGIHFADLSMDKVEDEHTSPPRIDWIEVGRASHRLGERHGAEAWRYAARLADEANAIGDREQSAFWRAVSASMRPRNPTDHEAS